VCHPVSEADIVDDHTEPLTNTKNQNLVNEVSAEQLSNTEDIEDAIPAHLRQLYDYCRSLLDNKITEKL
jgi:hypothetical protein